MDKQILHIAALNIFEGKLIKESATLDDAFELLDACVEKLELINAPLSWIAGHTLRKAGNSSLSLYKMILEGRLSERRELSYSLIESLELLIYIGNKALRNDKALLSNSSVAGDAANMSNDRYKLLWEGLNTRAFQLGFSHESLVQIIHFNKDHWGIDQPQDLENLKVKLKNLYRILMRLTLEGANCLGLMSGSEESIFFERLQVYIEQSYVVFGAPGEESNLPAENVA